MNGTRGSIGWGGRLLIAATLMLAGAAATVWALAHYRPAARLVGIVPPVTSSLVQAKPVQSPPAAAAAIRAPVSGNNSPETQKILLIEQRLSQVENAMQRAEGSAGRADALVIAFAARRAIDRGVALGYLETLLSQRFGNQHPAAVATIVTASHQPIKLSELIDQYQVLGPNLRRGGPQESWWSSFRRELGSLAEIHRADQPAVNPDARYNRALQRLDSGDVDQALAETMRLPGASSAANWTDRARRYVAVHRALDEIESAALMPVPSAAAPPRQSTSNS